MSDNDTDNDNEIALIKDLRSDVKLYIQTLSTLDEELSGIEIETTRSRDSRSGRQTRSVPKSKHSLRKNRLEEIRGVLERQKFILDGFMKRVEALTTDKSVSSKEVDAKDVTAQKPQNQVIDVKIDSGTIVNSKTTETPSAAAQRPPIETDSPKTSKNRHATEKSYITHYQQPSISGNSNVPKVSLKQSREQKPIFNLRYPCTTSQLGKNMVSTIRKAALQLDHIEVEERGYLVLETDASWAPSEFSKLLKRCTIPQDEETIRGFRLRQSDHGRMNAWLDKDATVDISNLPNLARNSSASVEPEREFQQWVAKPPEKVSYLICLPLKEHSINQLLNSGSKLNRRPPIPGVNQPYWYVSCDADTPAPMHKEDANTGSANLLLAGAEKHWLVIHRRSASSFEQCIRRDFKRNKRCSQFVRHHNMIVGPAWLKERNISFEVVAQRPGDVMCTLPGCTYHAVRNTGPNFAVAINFEFEDAADEPQDYNWCTDNCGPGILTLKSFLPANHIIEDRHVPSGPVIEDIISISDDESSTTTHGMTSINIPIKSPSHIVPSIKDFLSQSPTPEWFHCEDQKQLRAKLMQFSPRIELNDSLLRQLLQLISLPYQFKVVESLKLDASKPTMEHIITHASDNTIGFVFPFHVNMADQMATTNRNHWVLGILDVQRRSFSAFDLEPGLCTKWGSIMEQALEEIYGVTCRIDVNAKSLPPNPDGASCGLCCCLALEQYFGIYPAGIKLKSLRNHYLQKLLKQYQLSVYVNELMPQCRTFQATAALALSKPNLQDEIRPSNEHSFHSGCLDFQKSLSLSQPVKGNITKALSHTGSTITTERKGRLVQLIMQCSLDTFERLRSRGEGTALVVGYAPVAQRTVRTMSLVMEEISQNSGEFFLPILRQRLLFMELDIIFRTQVSEEQKKMDVTRAQRRRMHAGGVTLEILPEKERKVG